MQAANLGSGAPAGWPSTRHAQGQQRQQGGGQEGAEQGGQEGEHEGEEEDWDVCRSLFDNHISRWAVLPLLFL